MSSSNNHEERALTLALQKGAARADGNDADFAVDAPDEQLSARHLLQVVRRHAFLVIAVTAAAVGFRAWQLSKLVPQYVARSTVRFNDSRSNLTAGVGTNDQTRFSPRFVDVLKSQMELLSSRAVAEE